MTGLTVVAWTREQWRGLPAPRPNTFPGRCHDCWEDLEATPRAVKVMLAHVGRGYPCRLLCWVCFQGRVMASSPAAMS